MERLCRDNGLIKKYKGSCALHAHFYLDEQNRVQEEDMASIVVGVFKNNSAAREAMQEMLAAGFERNQIGVYSPHVPDPESARSGASLGEELRNEAGMDDLFRSLASIFTDYDELSVYSDAARQGQVVLSVTADNDDKVERVIDLMKRHSPIDVSEQLSDIGSPSQWGALDENNASENKLRKANERANVKNVGNLRIYSRN